jgi:hypothetical protein
MLAPTFAALLGLIAPQVQPTPAAASSPLSAASPATAIPASPRVAVRIPGLEATGQLDTLKGRPSRPRQKVVCGMTIVSADNQGDPRFVLAPKGHGELPIGRMPKPKCAPETEGNTKR